MSSRLKAAQSFRATLNARIQCECALYCVTSFKALALQAQSRSSSRNQGHETPVAGTLVIEAMVVKALVAEAMVAEAYVAEAPVAQAPLAEAPVT